MRFRNLQLAAICVTLIFVSPSVQAMQAQPVPIPEDPSTAPQIDISGTGIATGTLGRTGDRASLHGGINFSDSALLIGAAQKLYGNGIGSMGFGLLSTEDTTHGTETGTSPFLHQGFVDFQSERFEALIGRSDNPTAHLIDFPTLRGDDLVTLLNPLDPYSNGNNVEEHRYSNVASVTLNQNFAYFESVHAQHLINSVKVDSQTGINSFGGTLEYLAPPGLEAFQSIPYWGLGYEHITLHSSAPSGLHQVSVGSILNLNESVTSRWDIRVQNLLSVGSNLRAFSNVTDSYQADSNSFAASLRYLSSPFGKAGYQLALTAGYKNYLKLSSANSWGLALTGVKRLGQGFDAIAQYQSQWRSAALATAQSSGLDYEQTFEIGLSFNFDATLNPHLAPRRSLLNQQHQYVPN